MGIRTGPFGYLQRVIRQVWVVSLTCRLGLSYAMGEFVLWSRKREKNGHASLDFVLMPGFLRTRDGAISSDIAQHSCLLFKHRESCCSSRIAYCHNGHTGQGQAATCHYLEGQLFIEKEYSKDDAE